MPESNGNLADGNDRCPNMRLGDEADGYVRGPGYAAMYHFTAGSRTVIEMIVERFRAGGRDYHDADTLVFPLGLLSRHLVELRLKELHHQLTDADAPYHHRLLDLWRDVRPIIEARWPNANRSPTDRYKHLPEEVLAKFDIELRTEGDLDRAEALIAALDAIDPRGLSFRYPDTVPSHVTAVSLERLAETALELDEYLDGCVTGAYEEDLMRAEMQREFRPEQ